MDEHTNQQTMNPDYVPPAQPIDEPPVIVPRQLYVQQSDAEKPVNLQPIDAAAPQQENIPEVSAPTQPEENQPMESTAPQQPVQNPYAPNTGYKPYAPQKAENPNIGMANGMAIAALICGAVALVTSCCCIGGVPAILAVVFGIVALANRTGKKPMAIVGLCLGAAAVLVAALVWIYSLLVGAGVVDGIMNEFYDEYYDYYYEHDYSYDKDLFDYDDFM